MFERVVSQDNLADLLCRGEPASVIHMQQRLIEFLGAAHQASTKRLDAQTL